jgi:protein phosphatase
MTPNENPNFITSELSHPGEIRTNNEDRYSITSYELREGDRQALLVVVADGIGGHQAGEVAAQLTVDTIVSYLTSSDGGDPIHELQAAVIEANRIVQQKSHDMPEQQGMGSTVVVSWIIGAHLYTTSVGDSRIYLLRKGRLHKINVDHTWVQEAIEHNIITPDEAHDHPQAHVLRRYIGGAETPEPDMRLRLDAGESSNRSIANQGLHLGQNDQILLCTDGLTDLVKDNEIMETLQTLSPNDAVISLVNLARARGGHDNITTVIIATSTQSQRPLSNRRAAWIKAAIFGSIGLICLVLLLLIAGLWFGLWP